LIRGEEEIGMAAIGFIGLGNMGAPMAANLLKAGHQVTGFDLVPAAVEALVAKGGRTAKSAAEAAAAGDVVITMLPADPQVRAVYLEDGGVLASARRGALLIDCSTIDVETARAVAAAAKRAGFDMLDAPVSGGVSGAETASSPSWSAARPRCSTVPTHYCRRWAGQSSMPARPAMARPPRSATT
jgi:3-hydroxyisobutyrate dehydrogenase